MTQTIVTPQINATARMGRHAIMVAVALVSFASLLLELAMTRLFSVARFDLRVLGARLCCLNSAFIFLALEIVLRTPIALEVTGRNFSKLTLIYLVTAIPFFFTGLLFSVLFARSSEEVPLFYGADLTGGALACLAVVPLLNSVGAPNALLFASLSMSAAGAVWAEKKRTRTLALMQAAIFAVL